MRGLLFDAVRCVGCGACVSACGEQNGLQESASTELSDKQYTVLKQTAGKDGEVYYRRLCMHCLSPACASVCPVGALRKTVNGPVEYDANICLGCRYCIQACPFGIPRYEWSSLAPKIQKCTFCASRLAAGQNNACAEACPAGATMAGDRDELLKEARRRLATEPGVYVQRIYGEHEAGGTSVLFISSVPFDQFGLPGNLPSDPLPLLTFRVLSKIPAITGMGGVMLAGMWWLTKRKAEVARLEGNGGKGVRS